MPDHFPAAQDHVASSRPPPLKLAGGDGTTLFACPDCAGTGKAKQPVAYTRTGQKIPGDGSTIPCPACRGAKVV